MKLTPDRIWMGTHSYPLTCYNLTLLHIGGFAKRAHPARARNLNVNLARRNRDLQPGGKEIEGGGRGGRGRGGSERGEK